MLRLVTHPAVEPLHLDEAKRHLVVEHDDHNAVIASLIVAARRHIEERARHAMVGQQWELTLDQFPFGCIPAGCTRDTEPGWIMLMRGPVQSVEAISYIDPAGAPQTLPAGDYTVDLYSQPARIMPAYGKYWPSTRAQLNAVSVRFRVGDATPFSVNATTNVITAQGRSLTTAETVRLSNSGGSLPAGLNAETDYYVIEASGGSGKLALTSGGSAIDITDAGLGLHFLGVIPQDLKHALLFVLAHFYENREPVNIGNIVNPLPLTVEALIGPYRQIEVY
ncbi:MAG: head-tail connector protein [Pseudonocardiaceae bacterium]